jgi:hypothetical protein
MNAIFVGFVSKAQVAQNGNIYQACNVVANGKVHTANCFGSDLNKLNIGCIVKMEIVDGISKVHKGLKFINIKPLAKVRELPTLEFSIGA